jgi:hypothetical protein
MAIAMMGAYEAVGAMPTPRKGSSRDHKTTPRLRIDSALAREIAEHNVAVEAKRQAKKQRKAQPEGVR